MLNYQHLTLVVLNFKEALLFWVLVSCDRYVALPHGAMGWFAVCDCGIS